MFAHKLHTFYKALKLHFSGLQRIISIVTLSFLLVACVDVVHNYSRAQQQQVPPGFYSHGINFTDLVISPDASKIAFEYIGESTGRGVIGLGLYDLKTGKTVRIPTPAGRQFSMPSFSEDGNRLLVAQGNRGAVRGNQIAEIDLRTMQSKSIIAASDHPIFYPVYQTGTGNILYWLYWRYSTFQMHLLNPSTSTQQELISYQEGYGNVRRAFFVGQNDILFQGASRRGSEGARISQEVENYVGFITYRFRIGGAPQVLSAEAERNRGVINPEAFTSLSASADGRIIAYIRRKEREKGVTRVMHNLYATSNGATTQLTNLNSYIMRPFMSANASVIAFGADIAEPRVIDIYVYDMKTGIVSPTNLRQHITANPAFALN